MRRRLSNDFLLPTMITFLNDRDWQTRAAFFRDVACMAAHAGFAGMEAFLLPCVEQARLYAALFEKLHVLLGNLNILCCSLRPWHAHGHDARCVDLVAQLCRAPHRWHDMMLCMSRPCVCSCM